MRSFIEELCSDRCAGRKPGSPGGLLARKLIVERLRKAGLDPFEQPAPGCGGANVIAQIPGDSGRWVLVGAHYDHLGAEQGRIFRGADDNAAAVAILLEVGRALAARRPSGRGVLLAAFDGEEPPYFNSGSMGSQHFVKRSPVPLATIDQMICMDLVGHSLGGEAVPAPVRSTLFALGAERSQGTGALVDAIASAEPGLTVRRVDAETIPPLSDYDAFWRRRIPFVFLTCGRSRHYHTPNDTPETLDYPKIAATARWLERLVRASCERPTGEGAFLPGARDDASTLRTIMAITEQLSEISPEAAQGHLLASSLLSSCHRDGQLPSGSRGQAELLVGLLEQRLA